MTPHKEVWGVLQVDAPFKFAQKTDIRYDKSMENLMEKLNKEQLAAVQHKDGPLLIVAGAGTGKTTVITQKIAYMVEQGWAKSDEILAMTFTEKAAQEMEERVDRLLPMGYLDLWISTFHSFGEKILRQHGLDIGLPADFKLFNEFEQYSLMKKNLDKFELDYYKPMGNPTKFINALLSHFSRAKDEDISPEEYLSYAEELKENLDSMLGGSKKLKIKNERLKILNILNITNSQGEVDKEMVEQEVLRINEVANAYHVYQQLLLENSALDFGDLINYCLKLFRDRPAILEQYRKQFKYILLDEFQDTNLAQYELIKMLAKPRNNLVVVGDDDQCLPGSAKVLTKTGEKKIELIKKGEEVATAVGKGYLSYSRVNHVNKVKKNCRIIEFKTKSGKVVETTDNHKLFCHTLSKSTKKKNFYYVYLMHKQELGWRLGITNDLATRLRLERSADKIVALQSFNTEQEARYHETLWSLKYSIPTVCFKERGGVIDKKEWSEKLYQDLDVNKNVCTLANDLGIDLNYHQVCLEGVNRGNKVRIKINLEMCHRNYRSKYAKGAYLNSPQILHLLSIETSHKETIKTIEDLGYEMKRSKKGKRLRIANVDLKRLGSIALKIQKATGGIIENSMKVGKNNIQHQKALIIPASNVLPGMFLPVVAKKGVVYEQIVSRKIKKKKINVYDLEVDETHNFIANNIVVHNSIYKFRGASVSNILQFQKDFKNSKQVFLGQNYRNNQDILDISYNFIKLNDPNRLEYEIQKREKSKKFSKKLKANVDYEGVIGVIEGVDLDDEVRQVIEKIADLKIKDKEAKWDDFAILVRANDGAKDFCNALEIAGLPYQFLSSRGLYSKSIIMDLIAYFKLLDNYHESIAMYRVLNIPIFDFTYQELVNFNYWANKKTWSLYETVRSVAALGLGQAMQAKANNVLSLIEKHASLAREKTASEVLLAFLNDSGYLKELMNQDDEKSQESIALLNQFLKRIKTFEAASDDKSVKEFLKELQMEIDAGEQGSLPIDMESGPESIKIMTVHGSKGLEFKYVFIVNMVDKRFPTIERKEPILIPDALVKEILPEGDIHLEEERRLFYVAMTRAKSHLYFSWASDYGGLRKKKPSRFLEEISLATDNRKQIADNSKKVDDSLVIKEKKEVKKTETPIKVPAYFSYTQIAAFSNCPYQYRFAHILRIPRHGKAVFSFGKTMHSTLQKLFELINEKQGFGQADLFEGAKKRKEKVKISFDEILEIFEQSWIDDWYDNKKQKEEHKKKGKEILKEFYNKHNDNWPKAILLEKGFNIKLNIDKEYFTIRGNIDRVDDEDGKIKIIDYKTGKPKDKLSFEEKEQLFIYQLAAQEVFSQEIKSLAFYYLDNNSEVEFLGTDADLEKTRDKVIKTIQNIKKGEFPPKPGPLCKFCDFKDICEFKKA